MQLQRVWMHEWWSWPSAQISEPCGKCRPLDKQGGAAEQSLPRTATEVLKEAESELVTKEVAEQGGVVRGGTAAKVQVCFIFQCSSSLGKVTRSMQSDADCIDHSHNVETI